MHEAGEQMEAAGFEVVADAKAGANAPWLTLVHGMSQDRRTFAAQVAAFRERYRCLLVDLPGHGLSGGHPGPFGLAEYSAAVRGAMEAAGVTRTHYWGTHTGAGVGLLLGSWEPHLFASLVLEGPVLPGSPPPAVAAMLARVGEIARSEGMAAARLHWWGQSGWFAVMRARPGATRAAGQRAMVEDFGGRPWLDTRAPAPVAPLGERLRALGMPVLILNGEQDMADFLAVAEALEGMLPNVRRVSIPGGGGFPLWECPEAVNEVVAAFLEDAGKERST